MISRLRSRKLQPFSKFPPSPNLISLAIAVVAASAIGISGGLPLLIMAAALSITVISLYTGQGTDRIINRVAASVGGSRNLFLLLSLIVGISLVSHSVPAHAQLFEGARSAAEEGVGEYIGDDAGNIITIITFAMWALVAVGGIAVIAGGLAQNVMVLAGGLMLFFGMAILLMVLEFTDGLLFGA